LIEFPMNEVGMLVGQIEPIESRVVEERRKLGDCGELGSREGMSRYGDEGLNLRN
jgi:hypothetical protein